jgi:hypothetical protein
LGVILPPDCHANVCSWRSTASRSRNTTPSGPGSCSPVTIGPSRSRTQRASLSGPRRNGPRHGGASSWTPGSARRPGHHNRRSSRRGRAPDRFRLCGHDSIGALDARLFEAPGFVPRGTAQLTQEVPRSAELFDAGGGERFPATLPGYRHRPSECRQLDRQRSDPSDGQSDRPRQARFPRDAGLTQARGDVLVAAEKQDWPRLIQPHPSTAIDRDRPTAPSRLKQPRRSRDCFAPAPAVWSTAPTLRPLCLRPARSWLMAIRCRIAVAWRSSIPLMPCGGGCWRLDRQLPSTSDDCRSARPIRQARGRHGRAYGLPANLPATRSRRWSHEGDAPPGSRARLASKPDLDHHRKSTRPAVRLSSSSSPASGVILPGPAIQAWNVCSAAALAPADRCPSERVGRSVERHRAQIREHLGFVVLTLRGTCTITDVFVRTQDAWETSAGAKLRVLAAWRRRLSVGPSSPSVSAAVGSWSTRVDAD